LFKAVSGKDTPHNNFFFYDGVSTSGVVENISNATCRKSKVPINEEKGCSSAEIIL